MTALRHFSLSCCILCAMAGVFKIFWPENSFKPVINTVLLLYILASALRMGTATDWQAFAVEVRGWTHTEQDAQDYTAYAQTLGRELSAEALGTMLYDHGIRASVVLRDGVCHVRLAMEDDRAAAEKLLEENSGAMAYVLEEP